jgi:hypothetical protein
VAVRFFPLNILLNNYDYFCFNPNNGSIHMHPSKKLHRLKSGGDFGG